MVPINQDLTKAVVTCVGILAGCYLASQANTRDIGGLIVSSSLAGYLGNIAPPKQK